MTSRLLSLVVFSFVAHPSVAADRCAVAGAADLSLSARTMETAVRTATEDPCPDHGADGSRADKVRLLGLVRDRTLGTIAKADTAIRSDEVVRRDFSKMRAFLAMRHADVTLSRGSFSVTPELRSTHATGFSKLAILSPTDNAALQNVIGLNVAEANQRLAQVPLAERTRVIGEEGGVLRDSIRESGRLGYERLIAKDPLLLYIDPDQDVGAARERLRTARATETERLKTLAIDPPQGWARALIYFGPVVTKLLKEQPSLCAAFHGLRREQETHDARVATLTTSLGLAGLGSCMIAATLSGGVLGHLCLAASFTEAVGGLLAARNVTEHAKLLYGATLAGGGTNALQERLRRAESYQLAATLAITPVVAAEAKFFAKEFNPLAAARLEQAKYSLQTRLARHQLSRELNAVGVATKKEIHLGDPVLRILGAPDSADYYVRLAARLEKAGFRLNLSPRPGPGGAAANADFDHNVVTLFNVNERALLSDPKIRGYAAHEATHVHEAVNQTAASRIRIIIEKESVRDSRLNGYGTLQPLPGDEPFSQYVGGVVESTLSRGQEFDQLMQGSDMTRRVGGILNSLPKAPTHASYDPAVGRVLIEFSQGVEEGLPPQGLRYLRENYPDVNEPGKYLVAVDVTPNLTNERATTEAYATLATYINDLEKLRVSFAGQMQNTSARLSKSVAP